MTLGLIAGNGRFPFLLLDAARAQGHAVTVAAIREETDPEINHRAAADSKITVHWLSLGELSRLIEDVKLRRTLAANAKDWVSQNRDAMKEVPKIIESWEQLREERKREQPHPTESQWAEIEARDREEQRRELEAQGVIENDPVPAVNESG